MRVPAMIMTIALSMILSGSAWAGAKAGPGIIEYGTDAEDARRAAILEDVVKKNEEYQREMTESLISMTELALYLKTAEMVGDLAQSAALSLKKGVSLASLSKTVFELGKDAAEAEKERQALERLKESLK